MSGPNICFQEKLQIDVHTPSLPRGIYFVAVAEFNLSFWTYVCICHLRGNGESFTSYEKCNGQFKCLSIYFQWWVWIYTTGCIISFSNRCWKTLSQLETSAHICYCYNYFLWQTQYLKKNNEKLIRYLIIVVKFVKLIIINLSALFIKDECSYLEKNTQLIIININMSL